MADQKPFHETIIPVIHFIPQNPDETMLRIILHFIRITDIPKNHEVIISALEKTLAYLTDKERWEGDFRETILSVRTQKEAAEKVVRYEGALNFFESNTLMEVISQMMNPSYGITEISFRAVSTGRLSVIVKLPADFAEIIFGPTGLLSHSPWHKELHQI